MPQVLFAGYKVPHELRPIFGCNFKRMKPTAALEKACARSIGTLSSLVVQGRQMTTEDAYGTSNARPAWIGFLGVTTWTFEL